MTPGRSLPALHHARVQRWECDYNDHWNAGFYGRAFQMAAEAAAVTSGHANPGAAGVRSRHMRFHRELFVSAPVAVHGGVLADGPMAGAVVLLLTSAGTLSATALDRMAVTPDLPAIACADVAEALPRGLAADPVTAWPQGAEPDSQVMLGTVQPGDLDFTGLPTFERLMQHGATASHHQLERLGFTADHARQTGINRMAVEYRVTRDTDPVPGSVLRAESALVGVGSRSFRLLHRIAAALGETVAWIDQSLVAVDLTSRRAVAVPDVLRRTRGPAP